MPNDDLDHIPSIVPTRDTVPQRGSSKTRAGSGRQSERRRGPAPGGGRNGGAGILARLFITVSLVVAAVACAWAWQLQGLLVEANDQMDSYANRIADLEDRLSDTDEGMSQNAAVQAVKISELESEVRKLWDNVWKKSRGRLDKLEASSSKHGSSLQAVESSMAGVESKMKGVSGDIAKLKSVSGDLSRLMSSAKANQAEVERVADTLNRINLDLTKLEKRVQGNEEWVGSMNAFRKQVNASLTELQATVRILQVTP